MPFLFSYGTLQREEVQVTAGYARIATVLASGRDAWVDADTSTREGTDRSLQK